MNYCVKKAKSDKVELKRDLAQYENELFTETHTAQCLDSLEAAARPVLQEVQANWDITHSTLLKKLE